VGKSAVNKSALEGLSLYLMESRACPTNYSSIFGGATVSAEGIYAIGAAVIIIVVWRFR
jgi:hypothetical protein